MIKIVIEMIIEIITKMMIKIIMIKIMMRVNKVRFNSVREGLLQNTPGLIMLMSMPPPLILQQN